MNLWILASLVACFVTIWAPAIHTQGAFEDCCLDYHRHVRVAVLQRAKSYRVQEVSGSCNLPAVIFYFHRTGRIVCGNPQDSKVQKAKKLLEAKASRNSNHNTWLILQGIQPGKKLNAQPPSSKGKDLRGSSSSKRNASLT